MSLKIILLIKTESTKNNNIILVDNESDWVSFIVTEMNCYFNDIENVHFPYQIIKEYTS